jgi:MFS family permease
MPVPRACVSRGLVGSWVVPASFTLVAAASPFERPFPGSMAGFTLTTLELSVVVALVAGLVAALRGSYAFTWRTPLTIPAIALLACALIASVAAPEFRANSLRFVGRLTAALLLFTLAANAMSSQRLARQVIATLLGVAALVGAIAVLELAQVPFVLDALKVFRPGFHVVGGQLRATSTMFYPTITSMYLEVAFALGLVWIASSRLAFVALALIGAGIIATFTRAGLVTMTMSLLIYGGLVYYKRRGWDEEHTRLAALAAVLLTLVMMSRSPQMLVARMSTGVSQDWYGASYDVPGTLTLRPDSFSDVPVTLSNRGWLTWQSTQSPVFALSYHWLSIDTEEVVIYDGLRTPFTTPVEPGEKVTVPARVRAPGYPGTYVLVWDIVQEQRTWLSLEGVLPGRTIARVEGEPVGAPLPTRGRMPTGVMRMPRSALWATALKISAEHPVLGIGPDNFRLTYGRYLGLAAWDSRVHANNTYLEVLVGMGATGVVALLWLIVVACRSAIARLRAADNAAMPLVAAATAACIAIAAHGVVDSFLTFTSTYVVFALAAGVLFRAPCPPYSSVSSEAYANRV